MFPGPGCVRYPITPQTSLVENIADMWAKGIFPGEYVSVESEYSALSYLIGASYAGARTFTATSSQGLAYMHELLHWVAGARLPIVLVNVNRAMGAPGAWSRINWTASRNAIRDGYNFTAQMCRRSWIR